jgi:pimeloyl-ACP methyl ester carboxylesterase
MTSSERTHTIDVPGIGAVPVTVSSHGEGQPILLLHGGGGPLTVAGFAVQLAQAAPVRVLVPTHPGFGGTPRPDALADVRGLAALYVALLDALALDDVTVVGNSIGGWIAAEMALRGSERIGSAVLVDAVGIEVAGHPIVDFFSLPLSEIADYSYHEPGRFRIDPAALPPEAQAALAGNRAALTAYAGAAMSDPSLDARLAAVAAPTLVVWGESDRIADPDYGRAYAAAIPGARFQLLRATGHMPQLETPDALIAAIRGFTEETAGAR